MDDKWICYNCGMECDGKFCIRCGSPRPEAAPQQTPAQPEAQQPQQFEQQAPQAVQQPQQTAPQVEQLAPQAVQQPKTAEAKPKKKKTGLIIGIIAGAVVLVAAAVVCLFVFVLNKKTDTAYHNEHGNYSVVIPAGFEVIEFDTGFYAQKDGATIFAAYLNTDPLGACIYDAWDFSRQVDNVEGYLAYVLGVKEASVEVKNDEHINNVGYWTYKLDTTLESGANARGELRYTDADNIGIYIFCYFMTADTEEEVAGQADAFLHSAVIDGSPNVPRYLIKDLTDIDLGTVAINADLVGDIEVSGGSMVVWNRDETERVTFEIVIAPSVFDVIEREFDAVYWDDPNMNYLNIATLDVSNMGRYDFEAYRLDYHDAKNNTRVYEIYGLYDDNYHVICANYDVTEGASDWAKTVCEDIVWSWRQYK